MKLSCAVIEDLLPFYYDGTCSQVSREEIEKHLTDCASCQRMLWRFQKEILLPGKETAKDHALESLEKEWKKRTREKIFNGVILAVFFGAVVLGIYASMHYSLYGW